MNKSFKRSQQSGIVQGCPLSPCLFAIALIILMTDVQPHMDERYPQAVHDQSFSEIVYSDDILLIHRDISIAQVHVDCIRRIGKEYGLELNDAKLKVPAINSEDSITNANGIRIEPKEHIIYLSALLNYDGRIASELTRRIGMASRAFADLQKRWNHGNVSKDKKSRIYHACIVPKLMYGL